MATVLADRALPPQGINFNLLVHRIHSGENLLADNRPFVVVGFGGSHNDFSDVRYPAMGPTGATGDTAKCYMCHVQKPAPTEAIFPIGKRNVVDPQGLLNPAPATTSACTACHFARSAVAHANLNTDPKFGETCIRLPTAAANGGVPSLRIAGGSGESQRDRGGANQLIDRSSLVSSLQAWRGIM